ncbi:MAG TPA: TIM barrel protein [Candidatus Nanoarchaeia archaeon]|nr:TIM barrel protein [Candidatus Nanoarchaeia archaeon]
MIIKLGPAGSPVKTSFDGIKFVKDKGLHIMECEFVHGVKMSNNMAIEIGKEAKKHEIELSIHGPYYINLASEDKQIRIDSKKRLIDSLERGNNMKAKYVSFHPAFFGKMNKEDVHEIVKEAIKEMNEIRIKNGWEVELAPETTGKHSAYGSFDETLRLVKETKCNLCVDVGHVFARGMGKLDFKEMFDKLLELNLKEYYFQYTGINYNEKGELNHITLDEGGPDFREFAKELLKRKVNAHIICESPITWQDSLKMKEILIGLGYEF